MENPDFKEVFADLINSLESATEKVNKITDEMEETTND